MLRQFALQRRGPLDPVEPVQEQKRRTAPSLEDFELGAQHVECRHSAEAQFFKALGLHRSPLVSSL